MQLHISLMSQILPEASLPGRNPGPQISTFAGWVMASPLVAAALSPSWEGRPRRSLTARPVGGTLAYPLPARWPCSTTAGPPNPRVQSRSHHPPLHLSFYLRFLS